MTILFTQLDTQVILRTKQGIFRQAKMYRRDNHIYAGVAGGYVMLYENHVTSCPYITWVEMEGGFPVGKFGRLQVVA